MAESLGIFGAGALGTLLATRLARAGHSVQVFARAGNRREMLRRDGTPLHLADREEDLQAASLIFFCVKSFDTEAAARALAAAGVSAGICSFQNGWGNMEQIEASLPRSPLVAGATTLGAYLDRDGALHASTSGSTLLAPWGAAEYRWAEYAATLFESAGFRAQAGRDAPAILWRKLSMSVGVNPVSALSGRSNGAILESRPLLRIAEAAAREAARVGVRLGHVDGTFDPIPVLLQLLADTRENRSSMSEDLAHGRRTEADAIIGSVVRAAHDVDEPVPVTQGLWSLMRVAESSGRSTPGLSVASV